MLTMTEIDKFVDFLIRENCEGCQECEPKLSNAFYPKVVCAENVVCVEEGRAKWLLKMAEKYKAENYSDMRGWIPITTRPLTEEEKEAHPEWDEILDCPLPKDGEEVLISLWG